MINRIYAVAVSIALTACTAQQVADANARRDTIIAKNNRDIVIPVVTAVCKIDGVAQPILVPIGAIVATALLPGDAPLISGAKAIDMEAVHPAIVRACASVMAIPVGAIPAQPIPPTTAPLQKQTQSF